MVKMHKIVQSEKIILPGGSMASKTQLEKRLDALKTAINQELAPQGMAVMDIGYGRDRNVFHCTVPASYQQDDYLAMQEVLEKHCASVNLSDL